MDRRQESRSDSLRNSLCALFLVMLAACGGGGGGGEPNQTSSQSLPSGSAGSASNGGSASSGGATARAAAAAIDTADILGAADANTPFAQQSGYNGQVIGQYPEAQDIPESGINYSTLPNGETLRLGKVLDPWNPNSKVFAFQLGPNDPTTSGSKR